MCFHGEIHAQRGLDWAEVHSGDLDLERKLLV